MSMRFASDEVPFTLSIGPAPGEKVRLLVMRGEIGVDVRLSHAEAAQVAQWLLNVIDGVYAPVRLS